MKKFWFLGRILWLTGFVNAQIPAYYNDVDLTKTGQDLKTELANKIIATHTTQVSYSGLWNVYRQSDVSSSDPSKLYLIYGWENGQDSDCHNDILRDTTDHGGSAASCEYNREHVFPKSLGNPDLGTSGAGSDAHHVRPADVQVNGTRGNKKFISGSGHAGTVNGDFWYPGDEWKGDVARIIMYLYLRYDDQCLPDSVGVGNAVASDPHMIDLFLQWNAEDPPSPLEDQRNDAVAQIQGNRNPFIDNPYLATLIWGGPQAQDRWNMSVTENAWGANVSVYPNPAHEQIKVEVSGENFDVELRNASGQVLRFKKNLKDNTVIDLEQLPDDVYFLLIFTGKSQVLKKIIKQ